MLTGSSDKVIEFLHSQKEMLLSEWNEKVMVTADDPFKERMRENGEAMYFIIVQSLLKKDEELEKFIRDLAISVADQRVKADINIGDFVYNVNRGRSIIQKYLYKMDMSWTEVQGYLEKVNFCFDKFLYYATSHYSDAKDRIIKEKTQFIDSTHKDRLTLLGQMTSSFIHEFRNPLTSIQGFIQLLKSDHPEMKYLDIISSELAQLNFRISQFLLLSKKELIGKEKVIFSLNELLDEVMNFLYPSILDSKVTIIKDLKDEIYLNGYADEIRQVLINIIFNAIDVLSPGSSNPTIEVNSLLTEQKTHIKLDIANNGPKIPEHLLSSIFEPFVTTKKLGTGLGLFVCREIIEKHRGTLSCDSRSNLTVFSITLPIAENPNE